MKNMKGKWLKIMALASLLTGSEKGNALELVSTDGAGLQIPAGAHSPSVSADGRYVAFVTSEAISPWDANGIDDVYLKDRVAGTIRLISAYLTATDGNGASYSPVISADASAVAFTSEATNFVTGMAGSDTNGVPDVFVARLTLGGILERVSVDASGNQGNDLSQLPSISADGTRVAFESFATNLVAGDGNGVSDVFVVTVGDPGSIERVSVSGSGMEGNGMSIKASVSPDGNFVSFASSATNLVAEDTGGITSIFLRDLGQGSTSVVSLDRNGGPPNGLTLLSSVSRDGLFVAFQSSAGDLVADDANLKQDVFVHDVILGTTSRISLGAAGGEGDEDAKLVPGGISDDGNLVVFSTKSNLGGSVGAGISNVYVHDRGRGTTTCLSEAPGRQAANGDSIQPVISADGKFVVFRSSADNLVAEDGNGSQADIFLTLANPYDPRPALLRKLKKLKKQLKVAKKADQSAKVKRIGQQMKRVRARLRRL